MVGFAPCIFISGPQTLAPLLSDLKVSCSGDDAVDVGALAQPLLNDCLLTVSDLLTSQPNARVQER